MHRLDNPLASVGENQLLCVLAYQTPSMLIPDPEFSGKRSMRSTISFFLSSMAVNFTMTDMNQARWPGPHIPETTIGPLECTAPIDLELFRVGIESPLRYRQPSYSPTSPALIGTGHHVHGIWHKVTPGLLDAIAEEAWLVRASAGSNDVESIPNTPVHLELPIGFPISDIVFASFTVDLSNLQTDTVILTIGEIHPSIPNGSHAIPLKVHLSAKRKREIA